MIPPRKIRLIVIAATLLFPLALSGCPYMLAKQSRTPNHTPSNKQSNTTQNDIVYLTNEDFKEGTYRITQPGKYVLQEDISFAPNSAITTDNPHEIVHCCVPRHDQFESNGGTYPVFPFSMGFFSAITIETDKVEIDLNNHIIEQSKEHALMQRFFAVFELANTPFIPSQGPTNFGDGIISGKKIYIHDGTIGRSSHHGIHGNGNRDVEIKNVAFVDFEVAAVALNGVKGLKVLKCTAKNREDVPVLGTFASALFIHRFVHMLGHDVKTETTLTVQGQEKTITDIRTDLKNSIVNVYEDVVKNKKGFIDKDTHPDEYALFHNRLGFPEGNAYGFLTNHLGIAVGGFPFFQKENDKLENSQDVTFKDVSVWSLKIDTNEVVALRLGKNQTVVDALGFLFQVRNAHPDDPTKPLTISRLDEDNRAEYTGNVVANAQLLVSKCILKGEVPNDIDLLPTNITKINDDVIRWAEAGGTTKSRRRLSKLIEKLAPGEDSGYFCNADLMFHVNKGIVGFKIDGTKNVIMKYCNVYNLANYGIPGNEVCGNYKKSHPDATYSGYGGAVVRGFSFAGTRHATVHKCSASKLSSSNGSVIGFDIHTDSESIDLVECNGNNLKSLAEDGPSKLDPHEACVVMFRELTRICTLKNYCCSLPVSTEGNVEEIMDHGTNNKMKNNLCPGSNHVLNVDEAVSIT